MYKGLIEQLDRLGRPRVLVVGDFMLDRYIWGKVERISPEAPVQILNVHTEDVRPGGAANVAANARALGTEVVCIGAIGADAAGKQLIAALRREGIQTTGLVAEPGRTTPVKTRLIAHNQQMLRMDREEILPLSPGFSRHLAQEARREIKRCNVVLISDYAKGSLSPELVRSIISDANKLAKPVLIDPKGPDFSKYHRATAITPNLRETELVTGLTVARGDTRSLRKAASQLLFTLELDFLLVTRGEDGVSLFERQQRTGKKPSRRRTTAIMDVNNRIVETHIPARARAVFDVTGAGDTVLATLGVALGAGMARKDAVRLANYAAGIVVGKVGTATTTREELRQELAEDHRVDAGKVLPLAVLIPLLRAHRLRSETIVFTNGCFDILHAGHVQLFRFAKSKGDVLVVGLNSDKSVRKIKGPGRPLNPERLRVEVLSALKDIDYIVVFDEPTPQRLIAAIKPDVLVKGEDWRGREVVGADIVRKGGGRIEFAPLLPGVSTTSIHQKLKERDAGI